MGLLGVLVHPATRRLQIGFHPQNLCSQGPGGLHLPPKAESTSKPLPWQGQLLQHLLGKPPCSTLPLCLRLMLVQIWQCPPSLHPSVQTAVCWLPLLSAFLNLPIKYSFHQQDVTLPLFLLNSQKDYVAKQLLQVRMSEKVCLPLLLPSQGCVQHLEIKVLQKPPTN